MLSIIIIALQLLVLLDNSCTNLVKIHKMLKMKEGVVTVNLPAVPNVILDPSLALSSVSFPFLNRDSISDRVVSF